MNARSATGRLENSKKSGRQDNATPKGKRTSNGDPYRKFAVGNDNYKTKGVGSFGNSFPRFRSLASMLKIQAKIGLGGLVI